MSKQPPQAAFAAAALFSFLISGEKFDGAIVQNDKAAFFCREACLLLELEPFVLPDIRAQFGDDLRSYHEELIALAETLTDFYRSTSKKRFLIAPFSTIAKYLPAPQLFGDFSLSFGDSVEFNELLEKLLDFGYNKVDIVEQKGEFSFRGEVLDIFCTSQENAIRILFDREQIESIRYFDISTQKSDPKELESIIVRPALFALDSRSKSKMNELIETDTSVVMSKDIASLGLWKLNDLGLGNNLLKTYNFCFAEDVTAELDEFYHFPEGLIDRSCFETPPIAPQPSVYKPIVVESAKTLIQFHKEREITIALAYESQLKAHEINPKNIKLLYTQSSLSLIGANRLIISLNQPRRAKKQRRAATLLLDSLAVGDYVVHENYGIGRFGGLEQVSVLGGLRDFAAISYAGDERLLLPVETLYLIDRFVADSGALPTLDRLGKSSFARIKEGVKRKLYEIAGEIIRRAANREVVAAPIVDIDSGAIERFQNGAGFDYTPDQARSIDEIFADLASGKVMDRLLSGDVGFGKTEVAMNAILATIQAGFQAALIVPTTLLSHQHFESMKHRFADFHIAVERLDRYSGTADKRRIERGLLDGAIGVVVGTHALLSVQFKNLALMIIDEEHKFGVKQKEALKDKSKTLHLLSMSATPIPRSLNMALSQIKSMSQIETPPVERESVRTFVREADDQTVKEAILRELRRGGQVFYIYNRIAGIEQKKKALLRVLPSLRILTLHSQVSAEITETELIRFEKGEYDMLLSTTIIESGIHIPNVNTIVIDGADRFGIADLHQLRGRVGRSRRQGYCYFIIEDKETLTEEAKKRLLALENNSFLGSGGALAFHDLEIRGGGNILGADQSGHIKQIGFGLYLKMLENALSDLRGNAQDEEKKAIELRLAIKAFISEECVREERLRLDLYRRFSLAKTIKEVYDLEEELRDRFGSLDTITTQLVELMAIKVAAQNLGITVVQSYGTTVTFTLANGEKQTINSPSKDDDDVIKTALEWLRSAKV
ncbi:transcription-repair-coupling factor [Campylobacterota bacterium]|nr:transcription-repair-coupling factor [Campylobacterota bacterium]